MKLGVLILAAGESKRMGNPKQLLSWKDKSLIQHAIDSVSELNYDHAFLVVGAYSERILGTIDKKGLDTVFNDRWEDGMASSLAFGLKQLLKTEPDLGAVLITLADLPLIGVGHLELLCRAYQSTAKQIIATQYKDTMGVPVVFGKKYFEELLLLNGDAGAKMILKKHADEIHYVESEQPYFDVDTPEAYERLKNL